jgi:hypothetical protein
LKSKELGLSIKEDSKNTLSEEIFNLAIYELYVSPATSAEVSYLPSLLGVSSSLL